MTDPTAKAQDNDADEKPVKKSVKTSAKLRRPIMKQPTKVEEIKPCSTIANRRNAKREAKKTHVEEKKVMPATEKKETEEEKVMPTTEKKETEEEKEMPATEKKETRGRKIEEYKKYIKDCERKIFELDAVL